MDRDKQQFSPSRRAFLNAKRVGESDEQHIASVLVHAWPSSLTEVQASIAALSGTEVHATDDSGRLVVTVETHSDAELLRQIEHIGALPRVVSASLVYHQIEAFGDEA